MKTKKLLYLILVSVAAFALSCSDDKDAVKLPDLVLDKTEVSPIVQGKAATLNITAGSGKYLVNTQSEAIATATLEGTKITISAKTVGTTNLTVTDKESKATKTVAIKVVKGISLDKTALNLDVATTQSVTVSGDGKYKTQVSTEDIVTVKIEGEKLTVTGKKAGSTTVTITDETSNEEVKLSVTVAEKKVFSLEKAELSLNFTENATESVYTVNGAKEYTFTYSEEDVVTAERAEIPVNNELKDAIKITVLKPGATTITITNKDGQTAELKVTINPVKLMIDQNKARIEGVLNEKYLVKITQGNLGYSVSSSKPENVTAKIVTKDETNAGTTKKVHYIEITGIKKAEDEVYITLTDSSKKTTSVSYSFKKDFVIYDYILSKVNSSAINEKGEVTFPSGIRMEEYSTNPDEQSLFAQSDKDKVKKVTIPFMGYLASYAFYRCTKLEEVTIKKCGDIGYADNVETPYPGQVFTFCTSLKKVTIEATSEEYEEITIGQKTFYYCTALEEVILPIGTKKIEARAFSGCRNLKKIICKAEDVVEVKYKKGNYGVFGQVPETAVLYVPDYLLDDYKKDENWKQYFPEDRIKAIVEND